MVIKRTSEFSPERESPGVLISEKSKLAEQWAQLKAKCEAQGGKWDEVDNVCILPKKETPTTTNVPGSFVANAETGKPSGFINSQGQFVKASKSDIQKQIDIKQANESLLAGQITTEQIGQQQSKQKAIQQIAAQGILTPEQLSSLEQADIDWGQALTSGVVGAAPAAIGAAAGGLLAAGGGLTATGVGAPVGVGLAAAGLGLYAIQKLWSGTQSNIKGQQKGDIGAAQDVLTAAKTNMKQLRMIAETDPSKAIDAYADFFYWRGQVQIAQRKVQLETQGNLNKFMEDGTAILSDFELFLQPNGYADIQQIRLEQAISRGAPATPEELLQVYSEEYGDLE